MSEFLQCVSLSKISHTMKELHSLKYKNTHTYWMNSPVHSMSSHISLSLWLIHRITVDIKGLIYTTVSAKNTTPPKTTESRNSDSSEYTAEIQIDILVWFKFAPRNARVSIWWIFWGVALWVETFISKIWMSCQWAYTQRERTYTQNSHTQRAHINNFYTRLKSGLLHTQ